MTHIFREFTIDAPLEEVSDLVPDEPNEPRYLTQYIESGRR